MAAILGIAGAIAMTVLLFWTMFVSGMYMHGD
jgi:hypothetical protein